MIMDSGSGANSDLDTANRQNDGPEHDVLASPPQQMHDVYRKYQKMKAADVERDWDIIDFSRGLSAEQSSKLKVMQSIPAATTTNTFRTFLGRTKTSGMHFGPCAVYEHVEFPGLRLFPGLLPPEVQMAYVDRLLHRDLSHPLHKTNIHDDYVFPYVCDPTASTPSQPLSLFMLPKSHSSAQIPPRAPDGKQRPLNLVQFLNKRWRWLTMGTQYDWSTRRYPPKDQVLSDFPSDMADLVSGLFPQVRAESGVVLIYSPKDFMPVHRDVSELCERELCSFSLGCDGLFVIALDHDRAPTHDLGPDTGDVKDRYQDQPLKTLAIRVRSGDMLQMSGPTRWSWHAMPKVIAGTCPAFLRDWPVKPEAQPGEDKAHEDWRGYMAAKRINISCRQVYD